jgi:hypothetical protein
MRSLWRGLLRSGGSDMVRLMIVVVIETSKKCTNTAF